MLESLCQGVATIHELNLDGAFPERVPYRPRDVYEALKETPLFDAERGQWNAQMSEEQILEGTDRYAHPQLLGVLAEALFNPEGARELYEQLKATPLYAPERGKWNYMMSKEQELDDTSRDSDSQLVGVLVEAHLNPKDARKVYDALKASPLYDLGRGQWNAGMSEEQGVHDRYRFAESQLLGVLAEGQFNLEAARERYEQLKMTPLYDAGRGQWNYVMTDEQKLRNSCRDAYTQLLGILAEAQFDPERARERYDKLKATPLYDPQWGQWNEFMSDDQVLATGTSRVGDAQLVGVLVEAKLLSTLPRALAEAVPPLPITEDW